MNNERLDRIRHSFFKKYILKNNLNNNYAWLKDKIKKSKLYFDCYKVQSEEDLQTLRNFIHSSENIFEKDCWDINLDIYKNKYNNKLIYIIKGFTVKIGDIEMDVQNSSIRHMIKDCYINYALASKIINNEYSNKFYLRDIYLIRQTYTNLEIEENYQHSHTSKDYNILNYICEERYYPLKGKFCLGTGKISALKSETYDSGLTKDLTFQIIFETLSLLGHESKSGQPYRYVADLYKQTGEIPFNTNFNINDVAIDIISNLKKGNIKPNFDIHIDNNNRIKIINNVKFYNFLTSLFFLDLNNETENYAYISRYYAIEKDFNYYTYNSHINLPIYDIKDFKPYDFIFRGQSIPFNIENINVSNKEIIKVLHPSFIEQIKNYLEYEYNKTTIRESIHRYI